MMRKTKPDSFFRIIVLASIIVLINSCLGPRARMLKKARNSDMTDDQYDSLLSTSYTLKTKSYSSKSDLVHFEKYYVSKYLKYDSSKYYYSIIKLDTTGNLYYSQRINFAPNNKMLGRIYFYKGRYTINTDTLIFETLEMSTGDMELHNILRYAKINRDTLSFYITIDSHKTLYHSLKTPPQKFIFIDSLTEKFTYPPTFKPLDNQ